MADTDVSPEEIQSKLRFLRRPVPQKRGNRPAEVRNEKATPERMVHPGAEGAGYGYPHQGEVCKRPGNSPSQNRGAGAIAFDGLQKRSHVRQLETPEHRFEAFREVDEVPRTAPADLRGSVNLDDEPPSPLPASSHPSSPSSAVSRSSPKGSARGKDDGQQYLSFEELEPPAEMHERAILDVLGRLGSSADWSEQFAAIDDARRFIRFAPKLLLSGGHLRKLVALVATLVESLRSALAKNALRSGAELFQCFGRRLDPEIEVLLPPMLRRSADTNGFISEEAELALLSMCKHISEAKLFPPLQAAAGHRRPEIRTKAVWGFAMVAHRLLNRSSSQAGSPGNSSAAGRELLRSLADTSSRALGDASPEVRQAARLVATVLAASSGLDSSPGFAKLAAAVPKGSDILSVDPFSPRAMQRCGEMTRMASTTQSASPQITRLRSTPTSHRT